MLHHFEKGSAFPALVGLVLARRRSPALRPWVAFCKQKPYIKCVFLSSLTKPNLPKAGMKTIKPTLFEGRLGIKILRQD